MLLPCLCLLPRLPCSLSEATKRLAAKRILGRVSEAYGRMLLLDGLFQVRRRGAARGRRKGWQGVRGLLGFACSCRVGCFVSV